MKLLVILSNASFVCADPKELSAQPSTNVLISKANSSSRFFTIKVDKGISNNLKPFRNKKRIK